MNNDPGMLAVPDAEALAATQRLCNIREPYAGSGEIDRLFTSAMAEAVAWHQARCPFYASLLKARSFGAQDLRSSDDLARLPFIMTNFFKMHEVLSVDRQSISLHLTSSGTTGQKSQVFFDPWSIGSAQRMVDDIFRYYGWVTPQQKTNYLLFSYESQPSMKLGTAYTDNFLLKYAGVNRVEYALKNTGDGGHEFDPFGVIKALISFAEEGLPVRIFGFPAFMHFTLKRMRAMGVPPLKLHPDSMTFFGGGWKGHAGESVSKSALYHEIHQALGLVDARIRDGFGSVEHCIPYVECAAHELHVPVWSRVLIRDIRTLAPVDDGRVGYLSFLSPYITSMPAHHVVMGDLASLHPGSSCSCGLAVPYFRLHGRAGLSRNKSCAVTAAELLRRSP